MNNIELRIFNPIAVVREMPLKQKIFMFAMLITRLYVVVMDANKSEGCIVWRSKMDLLDRDFHNSKLNLEEHQAAFRQLPIAPVDEAFSDYSILKSILDECFDVTVSKDLKPQVDSVSRNNTVGSEKFDAPIPKVNCTKERESVENALEKWNKEKDIIGQSLKKLRLAREQFRVRQAKALSHVEKQPTFCHFWPNPANLRKRVRHF